MNRWQDKRILIVEDETHIAEGLRLNLELQGYTATVVDNGVSALEKWRQWRPDLIVLDIMLPGIDGFSVLQSIRLEDDRIPILVLSARGSAEDRIRGLTYGSDDYLAKPFHLEEFLLRVERLLSRTEGGRPMAPTIPDPYRFGENTIDFKSGTAECSNETIQLTAQEIKLLKLFVLHRGKPLSRARLLEIGWGYTGEMSTRTVDNFLVRFRKYFEKDPKHPRYFKSRRSVGYVFDPEG
jgi:two-component system alkaline phosphatase synthesis response regulator PhoP